MRILGIDYGTRRIGLALSDPLGIVAQPLETLTHPGSPEALLQKIKTIVEHHGVEACLLGLPLNMNGTKGEKAREVERFAGELRRTTGIPVHLWDERLTTVSVEKELSRWKVSLHRRKKLIDRLSAQLILQSYLDFKKTTSKDARSPDS